MYAVDAMIYQWCLLNLAIFQKFKMLIIVVLLLELSKSGAINLMQKILIWLKKVENYKN